MTNNNMKTHIYALIAEILNAETITKAKLALLSRDILGYVMDPKGQDIAAVNRLTEVLTPMNKATWILFAKSMLPWNEETDEGGKHVRFGKKNGSAKRVAIAQTRINDLLADPDANIWTWAKENVELVQSATTSSKKKDLAAAITKAVQKALKGDEKTDTDSISREDIMSAVILGGVDIGEIMMTMEHMEDDKKDAAARALVKAQAIKKADEDRALLEAQEINDEAILKANYEPSH